MRVSINLLINSNNLLSKFYRYYSWANSSESSSLNNNCALATKSYGCNCFSGCRGDNVFHVASYGSFHWSWQVTFSILILTMPMCTIGQELFMHFILSSSQNSVDVAKIDPPFHFWIRIILSQYKRGSNFTRHFAEYWHLLYWSISAKSFHFQSGFINLQWRCSIRESKPWKLRRWDFTNGKFPYWLVKNNIHLYIWSRVSFICTAKNKISHS